jgi:hypothetical protein
MSVANQPKSVPGTVNNLKARIEALVRNLQDRFDSDGDPVDPAEQGPCGLLSFWDDEDKRDARTAALVEHIKADAARYLADMHRQMENREAFREPSAAKKEWSRPVSADEALAVLSRPKTYTLPAGRMPAAREIAERCTAQLVLWEDASRLGKP